jgi:hypothetical protein
MNYTPLTREERYQIYALKKAGHTQIEIANVLERNKSTISRELSRNCGRRGYRPKQAHHMSEERWATNARTIDDATWQFTHERLLEQWSPEQISGHAAISPETIYQRVYADKRTGGLLWKNLCCQKKRKKRYGKIDRRGMILNRISIEERPGMLHAFFVLLAGTPDTNVLFRGGTEGLRFVQTQAADFLERGSVFEAGRQARAESLHRQCSMQNLSPGGCADLLAAAWFVHQLQTRHLS